MTNKSVKTFCVVLVPASRESFLGLSAIPTGVYRTIVYVERETESDAEIAALSSVNGAPSQWVVESIWSK